MNFSHIQFSKCKYWSFNIVTCKILRMDYHSIRQWFCLMMQNALVHIIFIISISILKQKPYITDNQPYTLTVAASIIVQNGKTEQHLFLQLKYCHTQNRKKRMSLHVWISPTHQRNWLNGYIRTIRSQRALLHWSDIQQKYFGGTKQLRGKFVLNIVESILNQSLCRPLNLIEVVLFLRFWTDFAAVFCDQRGVQCVYHDCLVRISNSHVQQTSCFKLDLRFKTGTIFMVQKGLKCVYHS